MRRRVGGFGHQLVLVISLSQFPLSDPDDLVCDVYVCPPVKVLIPDVNNASSKRGIVGMKHGYGVAENRIPYRRLLDAAELSERHNCSDGAT